MSDERLQVTGCISQEDVRALYASLGEPMPQVGDVMHITCAWCRHGWEVVVENLTINHVICQVCGNTNAFEVDREPEVFFDGDVPAVVIHFERLPAETVVRVHGIDEYWLIPASELIALVRQARPNR